MLRISEHIFFSFVFDRIRNTQEEIIDVLANNFDTPSAMTRLQDLVHWINSHMNYDLRDNEV
jgi:cysteinyl-tRNA synthetase